MMNISHIHYPNTSSSAEVYVARWQLPGLSVAPGDARWGGMRPAESAAMLELMTRLEESLKSGGVR